MSTLTLPSRASWSASPPAPVPASVDEYYRDPAVRARMREYFGAHDGQETSAVYVAGLHAPLSPQPAWDRADRRPADEIDMLWARGADIARSLWDRRDLIFLIELDYENIDQPAESYLRPADVFVKLEPAYRAMLDVLGRYDLAPLALATGRGYQFTGRLSLQHSVVARLAEIAPGVPAWHASVPSRLPPGIDATMSATEARASVGLGMLIEYVAHRVMAEAAPACAIPVVFNGTIVGSGVVGRECVSIDFSHAGDPLDVRHCRAAFSTYQWHRLRPDIFGEAASRAVPPFVAVPRAPNALIELLVDGRGLAAGARLARQTHAILPDVTVGIEEIADEYASSRLAAFHRRYYADLRRLAGGGPIVPDATDWPPCLRQPFDHPNDLLLKPEYVQHVVRALAARGWTAAAVARLVQQAYEADHDWGDRWTRMHPQSRAEFDVRVFAGLVETGLDALVDFNCVSAQEKDLCPRIGCGFDLRRDAAALKRRFA